jgi:hypothetical protein
MSCSLRLTHPAYRLLDEIPDVPSFSPNGPSETQTPERTLEVRWRNELASEKYGLLRRFCPAGS